MRIGIVILPQRRWAQQQDQWRRAEELGFAHAWTYDHLTWDPLAGTPWGATVPTLAAAAGVTSRIQLGTWVASPNYRHPVPFARELAALDDLSDGRILLGIGAGGTGSDATVLGGPVLPPGDRAARLEEFVELLDLVLTQQSTSYQGRFYRAENARTTLGCVQQPRLPFAVAANGPRMMRLAARHGAAWVTTGALRGDPDRDDEQAWWASVSRLAGQFDQVLADAGRDPGTVQRMLSVDAAPTFALTSVQAFQDAVGRASERGFTDVVVHWPLPGAPVYDAPESVLDAIAPLLADLQAG